MKFQYQIQLVFIRLKIKRALLSQSLFKITLSQSNLLNTVLNSSELKLRKNQQIVELDSMNSMKFEVSEENKVDRFVIKYEIKGKGDQRVRNIPINANKIVSEYVNQGKSAFQQRFAGENEEIIYKIYVTKREQDFNLTISAPKEQNISVQLSKSKSISRSKRPPDLNISRRSNGFDAKEKSESAPKDIFLSFKDQQTPRNDHQICTQKAGINLQGEVHLQKSQSTIEIEKVNELINSRHLFSEEHSQAYHNSGLSYKLKMVIILLIFGAMFLLNDALRDKTIKNKSNSHKKITIKKQRH